MTPERFQQIEELYHAAREATAEERAALLAQTDPELRREVESLLAQPHRRRIPGSACHPERPGTAGGCDGHRIDRGRCAWGPTASKASSARAAWAKSFGPSTRD